MMAVSIKIERDPYTFSYQGVFTVENIDMVLSLPNKEGMEILKNAILLAFNLSEGDE